jgi:hypothetical protein
VFAVLKELRPALLRGFGGLTIPAATDGNAAARASSKVYWLTIFRRGETGGERSHKMGSKLDPFRTTRSTSLLVRLPFMAHVSFSEYWRLG